MARFFGQMTKWSCLFKFTIEYKVSKTAETVDWESCQTKYSDILSHGVGWIQCCDVIVLEKFRFHRPHDNTKTAFSKTSTFESVFGQCFHQIRVEEGQSAKKRLRFQTKTDTCGRSLSLPMY